MSFRRWVSWVVVSCALACSGDDTRPKDAGAETKDAGASKADAGGPQSVAECFAELGTLVGPDYDQFHPNVGSHCRGTNHQDITKIERVVFLGDSVTKGTPPTPSAQFYRTLLGDRLRERFGEIEVADCSRFGARNDDFLEGGNAEIPPCFPEESLDKRTLTIFTMGGNDIAAWAQDDLSAADATKAADESAELLESAVAWLTDEARFPNGSFVVFANPYEFTDATGDLQSCPLAETAFGSTGNWISGASAVIHFQERYMEIAVKHQVDMIFLLETFCGHGFHNEDPESMCYRGPNTPRWFDLTCIHPNPEGHDMIADLFMSVVEE